MTDHSQAMTAKYRQDYQAPLYWIGNPPIFRGIQK